MLQIVQMPRTYIRKTKFIDPAAISSACEAVLHGSTATAASELCQVPRSTLRRHLPKTISHRRRVFDEKVEDEVCLRLLAFVLEQPKVTNNDMKAHCYRIACSLVQRDVIPSLPKAWFERKVVGEQWFISFKRRTNFTDRLTSHRQTGKKIILCCSCQLVHSKELDFYKTYTDEWECKECFFSNNFH